MLFLTLLNVIIIRVVIFVNELNTYIGKRIKEYRENRKLTQEYMAKELDVATNHYGRIERGENSCTLYNFIKICNLLAIAPNEIIGTLVITTQNDLSFYYSRLSPRDKEIVKELTIFLSSLPND